MPEQLNYYQAAPDAMAAFIGLERYLSAQHDEQGLSEKLIELVKIRVSQLNGCAYCLDMHNKDSRALAETEQRLYALSAWREAPFYTQQERAALAWCETLTQWQQAEQRPELLQQLRTLFDDKAIVDLTLTITNINTWNRLALCFGADVGSYKAGQFDHILKPS
ncbi:carboxymuconolactone decarboxylase family protein [Dasania marina]|uniref:carboxymuconolactone decarboxylase family protein n=1 Tax=Dasania marina TaxID=471499 RepID=UPI0030DBAE04|tara:strand:+ start:50244 stop:50735 length:492 start_codon:yes stop_codon:yes gene_type:complete